MTTLFTSIGRWSYAAIALIAWLAFQQFAILPQVQRFEELTGGAPLLEVPSALTQDLYAAAAAYPPDAVELYRGVIQPLDVVLPLLLGVALVITLSALTVRLYPEGSRGRLLPLLGVLPTMLDWAENIGVAAILRTLDAPVSWLDPVTRTLSGLKFAAASVILLTLGLAVALMVRAVRERRTTVARS